MFFFKLAAALISPLGLSLLLIAFCLWLLAFGWRRLALTLLGFGWLWLLVWSLPIASGALRTALEAEYPIRPVASLPVAPAIVVLGGAMKMPTQQQPLPALAGSSDRVWHAARLYHAGKAPLLLLSGGSDPALSTMSEARAMQLFLRDLGVPAKATLLEEQSRTTRQNAAFSAAILKRRGIDRVLLVTSALHMRRAASHFAAAGIDVIPAATDYETGFVADWQRWLPDAGALAQSGQAMKEWVGQQVWQHP